MRNTWTKLMLAAVMAGLVLPAPAPGKDKKKESKKAAPQLVWPLPPDKPRIKFLQAISGAGDVEPKKKASLLDRIAGIENKDIKPGFIKPYGIATDSQGRVYVTDSGQGVIFVFDLENKKVSFIGRNPQLRLYVPIGIAIDGKDRIWVADPIGQHVVAYDTEGAVVMLLGKGEEMLNPTSVAIDEARNLAYVVDSKKHVVLVYNPDTGELLRSIGKRGDGEGELNFPTNVALDHQGRLFVSDTINARVVVFDPDGKYVHTLGERGRRRGDFLKPKGVAFDSQNNVYVADADFNNVQIFNQEKQLLMFLGSGGRLPGMFWLAAGIHIDKKDRIFIADQNNRRIQIFQLLDGNTEPSPAQAAGAPAATKGGGAATASASRF